MNDREDDKRDIIDEDLYEEIDDEELYELVQEERQKAYERERLKEEELKSRRPFPKWIFWLIAIMMVTNIVAVLPNTFSIPAVDFLMTSAKLSSDEQVKQYKQSVVVVEAGQSKGTGFAIKEDGTILTNHHVIEGEKRISVAFPEQGLYQAEVVEQYPDVDLAVLKADGEDFPHLDLADQTAFEENDHVYFIGNPLRFTGIANQGTVIGYKNLSDWNQPVLMLDAPVYKGNSGSPVINESGEVIAVVFATLHDDVEGRVGLAVPIDYYYEKSAAKD
ncbi:Trypsin-like peptidase domain-containing protein [Halobacillus alkaliphilus]|uniref:Trypsin-like peptidase domain-containing protein n=1 Tax=Halobacillus alkaliphilus TaxID=396056 RepID=A0A1I2RZM6_9BACI|nr:serine protease [Halobacillus alkaliphilus]SFG45940.1 Trypsin-like peptidase domain-containing protein [Halobacillus alkaliphilus]